MPVRRSIASLALAAALSVVTIAAQALDDSKYPEWRGQWRRPQGIGIQWDPSKPRGLQQQMCEVARKDQRTASRIDT